MRFLPAALALAALGLSACGGDGGDGDRPTRAQFIARADTACTANNRRTRALNLEIRRASAAAEGERDLLRRLAPVLERGAGGVGRNAAAFEAAEPPAGDEVEMDLVRDLYDQQTKLVRRLAIAAAKGDVAAFKALSTQQDDVVQRARRLSQAYGFKECGSTKSDVVRSKPRSGDA